ncbi:MAG: signal peptidase I [Planctomycetes bacterium]|nr:signal peptidase I [Planctomycetota bacterium]
MEPVVWNGVGSTEPQVGAGALSSAAGARAGATRRFWRDVLLGGAAIFAIHIFLVQISVVRGSSMSPSLRDGDRLMVDRVSYAMTDVARFDVVVLRYPRNPELDFVKRVVGLPGDLTEIANGLVRVNGQAVPEDFAHICDVHSRGVWRVPHDRFFVLGDNRPISCDSREFGMVERRLLKGKVRVCFWPLDHFTVF